MDEYIKVCALYDKLCKERNCSTLWAANILDASQGITQKIVWQNFYAYMANTSHIYSDKWVDSLGEQVEKGLKLNDEGLKFKTKTVQNGTVTYIQMTPDILLSSNKDNMANKWLSFLKDYRKKHPGMSLKQAMKSGSVEYKKGKTTKATKGKKK